MGKKYIVEIGRLERLYKAYINENGKPNMTWLSPEVDLTPYTEPDLEQVRKEAYERGYETAKHECEDCPKQAYTDAIRMEGYQKGLSDAWEAARKIVDCAIPYEVLENYLEIGECTADVIKHLPASKAIEVIRQYEQRQEEIKVGDVVEGDEDGQRGVVIDSRFENSQVAVLTGNSKVYSWWSKCAIHKTGRTFPEIAAVLEKMRGEQGE